MSAAPRAADRALSTSVSTSLTVLMSVTPRSPATARAGTATAPSAITVRAARLAMAGLAAAASRSGRGGRRRGLDHLPDVVAGVLAEREIERERQLHLALHHLEPAALRNVVGRTDVAQRARRLRHDGGGLVGVLHDAQVGRIAGAERLGDHSVRRAGRFADDDYGLIGAADVRP